MSLTEVCVLQVSIYVSQASNYVYESHTLKCVSGTSTSFMQMFVSQINVRLTYTCVSHMSQLQSLKTTHLHAKFSPLTLS